ncbi:hypothetical protein XENOCAPTIV_030985 [Xenoophorus captivus]|uniref:Uncharacterized protein n=1 Tax=Xenoophorus captivus TaxID=1517983 RepID=A0ABV0QKY7_9TELE
MEAHPGRSQSVRVRLIGTATVASLTHVVTLVEKPSPTFSLGHPKSVDKLQCPYAYLKLFIMQMIASRLPCPLLTARSSRQQTPAPAAVRILPDGLSCPLDRHRKAQLVLSSGSIAE